MKQPFVALSCSAFLLINAAALGAQEAGVNGATATTGVRFNPSGYPPKEKAPIPATFATGITASSEQTEAVVQYGLSLPDPPPMWLPEGFHQTLDRFGWGDRARQLLAAEVAKPTPRFRDGHPDMNGAWRGCGFGGCPFGGGPRGGQPAANAGNAANGVGGVNSAPAPGTVRAAPLPPDQRPEPTEDQKLGAIRLANFLRPRNQPVYKDSADTARQHQLWYRNVYTDPAYKCVLVGLPRVMSPAYIVQTEKEVTFVYGSKSDANTWRVIPIGGTFKTGVKPTPYGQSVAHWEGDTLVVEVRDLDPGTWFFEYGMFHGPNMKLTERYRRMGDVMIYQARVDDPDLLAEPYFTTARYNLPARNLPVEAERCVRPSTDDVRIDLYPVGFAPEGN